MFDWITGDYNLTKLTHKTNHYTYKIRISEGGPSNVFPKPSIDSDAPSSLRTTGLETNLPTFFQNVNEKYRKKKRNQTNQEEQMLGVNHNVSLPLASQHLLLAMKES